MVLPVPMFRVPLEFCHPVGLLLEPAKEPKGLPAGSKLAAIILTAPVLAMLPAWSI